jgi:hypothetical protein
MDVEEAIGNIKSRTLAGIAGDVGRLIYLASARDYNTGQYYHEGLATRFTEKVAVAALAACHQEIFNRLVFSSLEDLINQLENYLHSTHARPEKVLGAWQKLEPYRVTIPGECDELCAGFFFSNVKTALAILQAREMRSANT